MCAERGRSISITSEPASPQLTTTRSTSTQPATTQPATTQAATTQAAPHPETAQSAPQDETATQHPAPRQEASGRRLPLTAAQTWVWYAQQADPDNPVYKAAEYVEIHGPVDLSLLERAVSRAVHDTDAFRVRFELDEDGPWQVLEPSCHWDMPVVDLRDAADPEAAAQSWMDADLHATVDPTEPPLFTFAVLRLTSGRSALYAGVHHLLLDGFGFSLFLQRIAEVYTALERDEQVPETAMGSLRQLVEDEVGYRESEQFAKDREYWMRQLAEMPEIVSPSGRGTGGAKGFLRDTGQVPEPVVNRLRALARRCRSSLPTVAMAALALYVHRETDVEDMLLELVVTGRQGAIARNTPGMLTNAPPLRLQVSSEFSVGELVRHAATRARGVLQHQRYPSMYLPWDLGLVETGEVPEPPAINIMGYDRTLHFGEHPVTLHNVSNGSVENLTVNVYERADDGSLRVDFNSNPAFYSAEDNTAHHRNFLNLLHALAEAEPDLPVTHVRPRTPAIAR